MLMDLRSKAESAEDKAEIKEVEHRRLMSGYQQRHAAREAKREKVKAERKAQVKEAREEARRKYVALKRELKQAAQAADEEQVRPDVAVAFGGEKRAFHSRRYRRWSNDFCSFGDAEGPGEGSSRGGASEVRGPEA
eukprot:g24694.t1